MHRNWAGNVGFGAARWHRPTTVAQLSDIVGAAEKVHALGTGHSFNDIADTTGDLVTVAGLPPVIDIDSTNGTVRVSAGLRYGEVAPRLHAEGWALPNLGSLPHISIAGACATGTHGSGDANGNLATAVVGLELVTASGDVVERDDVHGYAVGLGALGVVTHLTLRLRSTFDIGQYVYDGVPVPASEDAVEELFGAGYSVSLFTDWAGHSQAWVKGPHAAPAQRWLGGTLADGPRHPIDGMPTGNCTQQLGVRAPGTSGCRTSGSSSRRAPGTSCSRSTWCPASGRSRRWPRSGRSRRQWRRAADFGAAHGRGRRTLAQPGLPPRQPRPSTSPGSATPTPSGRSWPRWRRRWRRSNHVRTGARSSAYLEPY